VIGLSFFAGAFYRSYSTSSFSYGVLAFTQLAMSPHSWASGNSSVTQVQSYALPPRDLRMEIRTNATVDVYLLDEEGIKLWTLDQTLKPFASFKDVQSDVFTVSLPYRGQYGLLVCNPTGSSAAFEVNCLIYGFESDLLWISIICMCAGVVFLVSSLLMLKKMKVRLN
jgi:hypothetical protein